MNEFDTNYDYQIKIYRQNSGTWTYTSQCYIYQNTDNQKVNLLPTWNVFKIIAINIVNRRYLYDPRCLDKRIQSQY